MELPRLAQRHGRIVPENVLVDTLLVEIMTQHFKLSLVGGRFIGAQPLGQVHHYHFHALSPLLDFDVRLNQVVVVVKSVLHVEYPTVSGKARQQVLGPLPYKIPMQVRKAHEVG